MKTYDLKEVACKIFDILLHRVTTMSAPRIAIKDLKKQLAAEGIAPQKFNVDDVLSLFNAMELPLEKIERYCKKKDVNKNSLSALVVRGDSGSDPYPENEWFKRLNIGIKSPPTKDRETFILDPETKQKYDDYLTELIEQWHGVDIKFHKHNFREYLNRYKRRSRPPKTGNPVIGGSHSSAESSPNNHLRTDNSTQQNTGEDPVGKPTTPPQNNTARDIESFKWPVIRNRSANSSAYKAPFPNIEPKHGVFYQFGYRTGMTAGKDATTRQKILDAIFAAPRAELQRMQQTQSDWTDDYVNKFGDAKSRRRLKAMANVIATLASNFQSNPRGDYTLSIEDYKYDLDYLHKKYYVGFFGLDKKPTTENKPTLKNTDKSQSSPADEPKPSPPAQPKPQPTSTGNPLPSNETKSENTVPEPVNGNQPVNFEPTEKPKPVDKNQATNLESAKNPGYLSTENIIFLVLAFLFILGLLVSNN